MKQCMVAILVISIFGCATKPKHLQYQISKVELSRTGAWSDPGALFSVDSNLVYNYFGRFDSKKQNYYTGKVTSDFWDTLNAKLERSRFRTAPLNRALVTDASEFELIVYSNAGKKQILRTYYSSDDKSDSVLKFMIWLNESYKEVKLIKSPAKLKFEAVIRNPPMPKLDHVLFLPPKP